MKRFLTFFFFSFVFFYYNIRAVGQITFSEITPAVYDVKNGLAENNIIDGLIDKNNVLWVITTHGLSCFDGNHFINFSTTDSIYKLSGSAAAGIAQLGDSVFVATQNGIDVVNINTKKSIHLYSSRQDEHIAGLYVTSGLRLYYFTNEGDCINLRTQKKIKLPFNASEYFVTEDYAGNLYVSSFLNTYCVIDLQNEVISNLVIKREQANYGLFYSKSFGLTSLHFKGIFKNNISDKTETNVDYYFKNVTGFSEIDSGKYLMVHEYNKIIYRYNAINPSIELKLNQSRNAAYKKILLTKNNAVIALSNSGIFCFKLPYTFIKKVPDDAIENRGNTMVRRAMLESSDQKVMLFSYDGIQQYDPAKEQTTALSDKRFVLYSATNINNNYWIGTDGAGLVNFNSKYQFSAAPFKTPLNLKAEHIFSIYKENDRSLLLGYYLPFGLRQFDVQTKKMTDIPFPYGGIIPAQSRINHISRDKRGHFWIATDKGLFELDAQKTFLKKYDASSLKGSLQLPHNAVNYVYHDSAEILWVATDNGIAEIDAREAKVLRVFTKAQNLAGEKCVAVIKDNNSHLWVATYKGLSCVETATGAVYNYYKEDGLPDDEYNFEASLKTSSGSIYFGGLNGIIRIDPDLWEAPKNKSTIHLSQIIRENANGVAFIDPENAGKSSIVLNQTKDILTLKFTFTDYTNPGFCKYWYKIEGVTNNWEPLESNGTLKIWNLPIGRFIILIKGINARGNNSSNIISLPLEITESYLQSTAFKILLSLLFLIAVAGYFIQRYWQQMAIRSIKNNILNDIHDEVGSILTKSAMKAEVLNLKMGEPIKELQEIQEYNREAIQSLRNLLWSISSEEMLTTDFEDRMNDWMHFVFESTHFEFEFKNLVRGELFTHSVSVRRNLPLIIKELAHNTIKHSAGDFFRVTLSRSGKKYKLSVMDNGNNADEIINKSGYGLKSIESRVASMNGVLSFKKNKDGFFTEIIF